MRKSWCVICLAGLPLAAVSAARCGNPAEPRAVIDRAIQALGGEANLSKHKATTSKGKGTYYGGEQPIPYTGAWAAQLPEQLRVTTDFKFADQPIHIIFAINGDKGWSKQGDKPALELSKERLAEERERLYGEWVSTLLPLKDNAFKLNTLGDAKVDGRPASGVRVSREGHRDVSLYFDKASGLLVKAESTVIEMDKGGATEKQELYQSDFKEIDGVKHAMKYTLNRNGKRFADVEFSEIHPVEKLDARVFAQP